MGGLLPTVQVTVPLVQLVLGLLGRRAPRPPLAPEDLVSALEALLEGEEWRSIPGHARYEASSLGRIRGPRGIKALSPWRDGYLRAWVDGRSLQVSRLVLAAFRGWPLDNEEASHLDGNPLNNRLDNLAWEDHAANMARKFVHGTNVRGERVNTAKLTASQVQDIRRLRAEGRLLREIADQFGVTMAAISAIVNRKNWKHVA